MLVSSDSSAFFRLLFKESIVFILLEPPSYIGTKLTTVHPETQEIPSPLMGRVRVGVFPLPFIPSSPSRRLSEPEAARGGERVFVDGH